MTGNTLTANNNRFTSPRPVCLAGRREKYPNERPSQRIPLREIIADLERPSFFTGRPPARLTAREFDLLLLLIRNKGRALAHEWLFEQIWGHPSETSAKTLAVYVHRLRSKIEDVPDTPSLLLTVRGYGYRFETPTETEG